jgi:hypothetical protein
MEISMKKLSIILTIAFLSSCAGTGMGPSGTSGASSAGDAQPAAYQPIHPINPVDPHHGG